MMAHCEGILPEKNLLTFLFGILVWFCPLFCRCLSLTALDLRGMNATQISTVGAHSADGVIDGNLETHFRGNSTCSHTWFESHPWWKVDLGTNHCLGRITLVNRGDCCNDRLLGAIVRAGLESDIFNNAACGIPVTSVQASIPGAHIPIMCDPPVIARYVSVDDEDHLTDTGNNILTLCEVMVDEYTMENCPQTTIGTPTAAMVVDKWFAGTCKSTLLFVRKRIAEPRPLMAMPTESPKQCFLGCKVNNECWSFDYVMTSGQCRLYDVKAGDLKVDDQPGCLVYAVVHG